MSVYSVYSAASASDAKAEVYIRVRGSYVSMSPHEATAFAGEIGRAAISCADHNHRVTGDYEPRVVVCNGLPELRFLGTSEPLVETVTRKRRLLAECHICRRTITEGERCFRPYVTDGRRICAACVEAPLVALQTAKEAIRVALEGAKL